MMKVPKLKQLMIDWPKECFQGGEFRPTNKLIDDAIPLIADVEPFFFNEANNGDYDFEKLALAAVRTEKLADVQAMLARLRELLRREAVFYMAQYEEDARDALKSR